MASAVLFWEVIMENHETSAVEMIISFFLFDIDVP